MTNVTSYIFTENFVFE